MAIYKIHARRVLLVRFTFCRYAKNTFHRFVQNFLVELTRLHGRCDLFIGKVVAARHFEIQPCGKAFDAIHYGAPIAHYKSAKFPFAP